MAIKKRRRVKLNSSPAGRPGRHSLTPVKGKKKAAVPKPSMGVGGVASSTGGPGKFPGKYKYKPTPKPAAKPKPPPLIGVPPGGFRKAPKPTVKPKPRIRRKPKTRKATTRQRRF